MSVPKHYVVHVEFGCSSENISFSTELFSSAHSNHFNFNCVDIVYLQIREVYDHFLEAVIWSSVQNNSFIVGPIANIAYIHCSKFEKLGVFALLAF